MKFLLSPHLFVSSVSLIMIGLALMLALRLSYRRALTTDPVFTFVRTSAIVLLLIGWLALMIAVAQPVAVVASTLEYWLTWWMRAANTTGIIISQIVFGVLAWLTSLVLIWLVLHQFRSARKRTNATLLSIAVKNQIPVPDCITSFAREQGGRFETKAIAFADDLRNGMPLETAIPRHRGILPRFIELTTHIGQTCDNLAAALKYDLASDLQFEPIRRAFATRMLYLATILLLFAALITFIYSYLGRMYSGIFGDFEAQLPLATTILISYLNQSLLTLMWFAVIVAAIVSLYIAAWSLGFALPVPLGLGWFATRSARGTIERALAFPAEQQRPLGKMLDILAKYYPARSIRSKLKAARNEMNDGRDWIESLNSTSLLGKADVAVISAAQRAGNLAWALREMAESNERRLIYRLNALIQVGSVFMIVALGGLVLFLCVALFLPLAALIEALA